MAVSQASNKEELQRFKDDISIVDVVRHYLPSLKRQGQSFVALCPFHEEKTPSFHVSDNKKMFHCYGCGKWGDVFTFVQEMDGLGFKEALTRVSEMSGRPAPSLGRGQKEQKREAAHQDDEQRSLTHALKESLQFYQARYREQKRQGSAVSRYLLQRGLSEQELIKAEQEFKLGYAPDSWDALKSHLESKKIDPETMRRAGLLSANDRGRTYDRFRNRLLFPITDPKGELVAFGGRALTEDAKPKYLNSPESEVFQKRKILYGYYKSKEEMRKSHRAFVMEGYLDVIAAHIRGLRNSVATLGTALSEEHLQLIHRYANEVYLVFDMDSAGQQAAVRVAQLVRQHPQKYYVMAIPEEKDPFDYFVAHDLLDFMSLLSRAKELVDFELEYYIKHYGESEGIDRGFDALRRSDSAIKTEKGLKHISTLTGISFEALQRDFDKGSRGSAARESARGPIAQGAKLVAEPRLTGYAKVMHQLLLLGIQYPVLLSVLLYDFNLRDFPVMEDRELFMKLSELHIAGQKISMQQMDNLEIDPKWQQKIVGELFSRQDKSDINPMDLYEPLKWQAKVHIIKEKIQHIRKKLDRIAKPEEKDRLLGELATLENDKQEFQSLITTQAR